MWRFGRSFRRMQSDVIHKAVGLTFVPTASCPGRRWCRARCWVPTPTCTYAIGRDMRRVASSSIEQRPSLSRVSVLTWPPNRAEEANALSRRVGCRSQKSRICLHFTPVNMRHHRLRTKTLVPYIFASSHTFRGYDPPILKDQL